MELLFQISFSAFVTCFIQSMFQDFMELRRNKRFERKKYKNKKRSDKK